MIDQTNKRKHERLSCVVPIEARADSFFRNVKTTDLSKGGVGLVSEFEVSIGQEIAIEIQLGKSSDSVLAIGKVQWVELNSNQLNYRIGMHFKEVLQGSKSRLNKFFS
ncbi:MAG: PilZ domain-containing protein [Candidatus Zapsychrus exili]|nr:PilZ domain-containing protein [Candidatus Zapsychrus exili]